MTDASLSDTVKSTASDAADAAADTAASAAEDAASPATGTMYTGSPAAGTTLGSDNRSRAVRC